MSNDKGSPEVNYQSLWRSYDKWQQEDRMWYETRKSEEGKGADLAGEKASMSSRGLQSGSDAWNRRLEEVKAKRPDLEAEYAAKQEDLKSSVVYEDLHQAYLASESGRERAEKTKFAREVRKAIEPSFDDKIDPRYKDIKFYGDPESEAYQFSRVSGMSEDATPVSLGELGFSFDQMTFEDWGKGKYGSTKAENIYAAPEATESEKAEARVKVRAQGRGGGAGGMFALSAFEENPWML